MKPRPIKCAANLADGTTCDEFAIVTDVQYVYERLPQKDQSSQYDLKEIHYHAICPKCGDRKLIETP